MRPWLLEVNLSPSLDCDSPLDWKVKTHMLSDLFSLVGIIIRNPCRKGTCGPVSVMPKRPSSSKPVTASRQNLRSEDRPLTATRPLSREKTLKSKIQVQNTYAQANKQYFFNALTRSDSQLLRRAKEEFRRRGGWVRVFPTEVSFLITIPNKLYV